MLRKWRARFKSNRSGRRASGNSLGARALSNVKFPTLSQKPRQGWGTLTIKSAPAQCQIRLFFACALSFDVILNPAALQATPTIRILLSFARAL
jgi:hypothetical protein